MLASSILFFICRAAVVFGHGQITAAIGDSGKSVGFKVDDSIARNCSNISPCQQDATIIRQAEIDANIVNECGRTELSGNIDVGQNTEDAIAAGAVTKVKQGTAMTVTIHQVNADGAGPYVCDLDETGNAGIISQNLSITDNVPGANGFSQAQSTDFNMTVTMPVSMKCTGGSTGNICTVRCRNNAVAGPFGGCFAVMQTDVAPTTQNPDTISTAQTLESINKQIAQNLKDLPAAIQANAQAGSVEAAKGAAAANAPLGAQITTSASSASRTLHVTLGTVATATSAGTTTIAGASEASRPTASTAAQDDNANNSNANKGNAAGEKARKNRNDAKRSSTKLMRRGMRAAVIASDSYDKSGINPATLRTG